MSCINCEQDFFTGRTIACVRCARMAHEERMATSRRVGFFAPVVVVEREVEVERVVVRDRGEEAVGVGLAVGAIFGTILGALASSGSSKPAKKQASNKKR